MVNGPVRAGSESGRELAIPEEIRAEVEARVLTNSMPEPNSGCWLWVGCASNFRAAGWRGIISVSGSLLLAHRVSYALYKGPIPAGMLVCHKCDNGICVNPDHLWLGTQLDNVRDMLAKRRSAADRNPNHFIEMARKGGRKNTWSRGAGNPRAKLTEATVLKIRGDKRPTRILVAEYGVSRALIQDIRAGRKWRCLGDGGAA